MNLLIIIGNAVVDFHFRAMLLKDPVSTVEAYGFRLTKGEMAMLRVLFSRNTVKVEEVFLALQEQLYTNIADQISEDEKKIIAREPATDEECESSLMLGCTKRPCTLSLSPPSSLKDTWRMAGETKQPVRGVATKI